MQKITGIIGEFNPFHNGHKKLVNEIRKNGSYVVAVMSGSFVQHGEPAVFDKFSRTETALSNGIDAVIELPAAYALQSADGFAFGGTSLLYYAGADEIAFGSECGDISLLENTAVRSEANRKNIDDETKKLLGEGLPYAKARLEAEIRFNSDAELLKYPNNLLAAEYIKAIRKNCPGMIYSTVKRESADSENPSARNLRRMLLSDEDISSFVPGFPEGCPKISLASFYDTISYILRSSEPEKIAAIQGISEGLENRMIQAAFDSSDIDSFMKNTVSRRYTETRIKRALCSVLLGLTYDTVKLAGKKENMYLRILGFRNDSREIISMISERAGIPVITKAKEIDTANPVIKKDLLATDLYFLATRQTGRRDYTGRIITV